MASQLAVWTVERIFDMGAFALIMAVIFWPLLPNSGAKSPPSGKGSRNPSSDTESCAWTPFLRWWPWLCWWVWQARPCSPSGCARTRRARQNFLPGYSARISPRFGLGLGKRVQAFGEGLNTVKDLSSFFELASLSLLIWMLIGFAYMAVTNAYSIHRLSQMTLSSVFLLTAASVVGGILQLPVVGGGSQLATIGMLHLVFKLPPELAISCGMMLWLVTFMSVIPAGLALARSEHVSLMRIEEESLKEEHKALGEENNNPATDQH